MDISLFPPIAYGAVNLLTCNTRIVMVLAKIEGVVVDICLRILATVETINIHSGASDCVCYSTHGGYSLVLSLTPLLYTPT